MPELRVLRASGGYSVRCDLLVGLDGVHVIAVERDPRDRLVVTVESAPEPMRGRFVASSDGRTYALHYDSKAQRRAALSRWVHPAITTESTPPSEASRPSPY